MAGVTRSRSRASCSTTGRGPRPVADQRGARLRRPRRAREKGVEAAIDQLCAKAGCVSVRFSQARATNQTPGIPDRRYYVWRRDTWNLKGPEQRLAFWVEVKAPGGRQSSAQRTFQGLCELAGDPYVLGGFREVLAFLIRHGLWKLPAGVNYIAAHASDRDDVARTTARYLPSAQMHTSAQETE
jgi:hypothetical protein